MIRAHSQAGPVKYAPVDIETTLWMPSGSHQVTLVMTNEPSGQETFVHRSYLTILGE